MAFTLRVPLVLCGAWMLVSGCGASNTADALIGPEGGMVAHDDGVTLVVPPGALLVTRQIIIRPSEEKLSRGSFEQVGGSYLIEPRDLEFRVPAELTFDTKVEEKPTVLLMPKDKAESPRVIAYSAADDRPTAYIGSLGIVAAAKGSDPVGVVDSPMLARTPSTVDLGKPFIDTGEIKVSPKGVTSLDVGFTAFDISGESKALLNGDGTSYCGFKFGAVLGASITGGCSSGVTSGTLNLSSTQATIEVKPFLIGKLERPVVVEVQVGTNDLAISAGYFAFNTSGCFLESCSGHGLCMDSGNESACMCDDGFAPGAEPLSCDCVPKCDDVECGDDGCGGQCAPGCNSDTHTCNGETRLCDPLPPPETTGDMTTTTGDGTTTTGDGTSTTGDGTTSTTTGDGTSSSSGGGSSSGSSSSTG
jgi:hypothetical protein